MKGKYFFVHFICYLPKRTNSLVKWKVSLTPVSKIPWHILNVTWSSCDLQVGQWQKENESKHIAELFIWNTTSYTLQWIISLACCLLSTFTVMSPRGLLFVPLNTVISDVLSLVNTAILCLALLWEMLFTVRLWEQPWGKTFMPGSWSMVTLKGGSSGTHPTPTWVHRWMGCWSGPHRLCVQNMPL